MRSASTSGRSRLALGALVVGYLLLSLVAGAPGSPLLPALPAGAGVPSWARSGASALGFDTLGTGGLTALTLALIAALLAAFGVVLMESLRGKVRVPAVLAAVGASLLVATAGPLVLSRDVNAYAAYGRIVVVHDSNPYVEPPSSFPADPFAQVAPGAWRDTRSLYGPAFTLASAGIAGAFEDSPEATITAFKVLAGASVALAVLLVVAAARRLRPGREAVAAAALGLNPVIVIHTVGGGHNDALIAALLAGGVVVAGSMRWGMPDPARSIGFRALAVTGLLTLVALVKVVVGVPLVLWVWALAGTAPAGNRGRVVAAHVGLAALIAAAFFAPFLDGVRSLSSLATLASVEGWASGPALVARGAREIGEVVGGIDLGEALAGTVTIAFLAAVALVVWRLARRTGSEGPTQAHLWGAALLLLALGSPYLVPWYAAWFVPFLFLMADERLALIGLVAAALLALTGVPSEPGPDPGLYDSMRLAVHYAVAPIMLAIFGAAVLRLRLGASRP
jgi:alpha-1,6-mannosyltransferase